MADANRISDKVLDAYKEVEARMGDLERRFGAGEFKGRGEDYDITYVSILNQEKGVIRGLLAGGVPSTDAALLQKRMQDVEREIARTKQNHRDLHHLQDVEREIWLREQFGWP
jgi:hypothetical protein